jgi:hypothetical protein
VPHRGVHIPAPARTLLRLCPPVLNGAVTVFSLHAAVLRGDIEGGSAHAKPLGVTRFTTLRSALPNLHARCHKAHSSHYSTETRLRQRTSRRTTTRTRWAMWTTCHAERR